MTPKRRGERGEGRGERGEGRGERREREERERRGEERRGNSGVGRKFCDKEYLLKQSIMATREGKHGDLRHILLHRGIPSF